MEQSRREELWNVKSVKVKAKLCWSLKYMTLVSNVTGAQFPHLLNEGSQENPSTTTTDNFL